jgi:hypothetical protein
MIPGPFSICLCSFDRGRNAMICRALRSGFESALHAYDEIEAVAEEAGVPPEECVIMRYRPLEVGVQSERASMQG